MIYIIIYYDTYDILIYMIYIFIPCINASFDSISLVKFSCRFLEAAEMHKEIYKLFLVILGK